MLTCAKTNVGNGVEVGGLTSLIKALHSVKWGFQPGFLHLRQMNPHLDPHEHSLVFATEAVEYRMRSTFTGVNARGFGGTNVHVLCYGNVDEGVRPPQLPLSEEKKP